MRHYFDYDSKLIRTLNKISDLMILNVLTILCSLPIVTMGAAVTALYDAIWRIQQYEEIKTVRTFFDAFKANFKKATLLWLIYLPIGVLAIWNLNTTIAADNSLPATVLSIFAAMWWVCGVAWVFPLQSRFENTVWNTFKNSLMAPLGYFPKTLAMGFLNVLPWVLALANDTNSVVYFTMGGLIWLLIYFALAAHLNLKLLDKAFDRFYAQAEQTEE